MSLGRDGDRLVIAEGQRERLWNMGPRRDTFDRPGLPLLRTSVAFSPDGNRLAVGTRDGAVEIRDGTSGPSGILPGR